MVCWFNVSFLFVETVERQKDRDKLEQALHKDETSFTTVESKLVSVERLLSTERESHRLEKIRVDEKLVEILHKVEKQGKQLESVLSAQG